MSSAWGHGHTNPDPSDLIPAAWAQVRRIIPAPRPGGRPAEHDRREIVNALLDVSRTGCQWRALLCGWCSCWWLCVAVERKEGASLAPSRRVTPSLLAANASRRLVAR